MAILPNPRARTTRAGPTKSRSVSEPFYIEPEPTSRTITTLPAHEEKIICARWRGWNWLWKNSILWKRRFHLLWFNCKTPCTRRWSNREAKVLAVIYTLNDHNLHYINISKSIWRILNSQQGPWATGWNTGPKKRPTRSTLSTPTNFALHMESSLTKGSTILPKAWWPWG